MANTAMTVGVAIAASQADQETGTSTTTVVTPGRQKFHPCASKAWVNIVVAGGAPSVAIGYNVTSISDGGVGIFTANFTTSFSSADYACSATGRATSAENQHVDVSNATAPTASALQVKCWNASAGSAVDLPNVYIICFGDQ